MMRPAPSRSITVARAPSRIPSLPGPRLPAMRGYSRVTQPPKFVANRRTVTSGRGLRSDRSTLPISFLPRRSFSQQTDESKQEEGKAQEEEEEAGDEGSNDARHLPRLRLSDEAGQLATMLYVEASKVDGLDSIAADMAQLVEASGQDVHVRKLLAGGESGETLQKQLDVLSEYFQFHPLTTEFLSNMATQNKLSAVLAVARNFEQLLMDARHEVPVTITAPSHEEAQELAHSEMFDMLTQGFVEEGETLRIETKVDPTLAEGFKIDVAGYSADFSLKPDLAAEERRLKGLKPEGVETKTSRLKDLKTLVTEEEAAKAVDLLRKTPFAKYMKIDEVYNVKAA